MRINMTNTTRRSTPISESDAVTGADGRYRFITAKPGAYPWANGPNTRRPAHFTSSSRAGTVNRLVTQMSFRAIRCFRSTLSRAPCRNGRASASFAASIRRPPSRIGLSYLFDFVLRGRDATPMEN